MFGLDSLQALPPWPRGLKSFPARLTGGSAGIRASGLALQDHTFLSPPFSETGLLSGWKEGASREVWAVVRF